MVKQICIFFSLQIDSALPSANLTLVDDLVKAGTLAVNINKFDNGSGVRDVDIYNKLRKCTYTSQDIFFYLTHQYLTLFSIKIGNFCICFCSFELSCSILSNYVGFFVFFLLLLLLYDNQNYDFEVFILIDPYLIKIFLKWI